MLNYPDPFEHPNAYWQLTHDDNRLTERQKRQMLKAVGMDYDKEPKKTKQEMELSAQPKRTETTIFDFSVKDRQTYQARFKTQIRANGVAK